MSKSKTLIIAALLLALPAGIVLAGTWLTVQRHKRKGLTDEHQARSNGTGTQTGAGTTHHELLTVYS